MSDPADKPLPARLSDALGDAYAGHFAEGRGMSAEDAIAHLRSGSAGVAAPSTR